MKPRPSPRWLGPLAAVLALALAPVARAELPATLVAFDAGTIAEVHANGTAAEVVIPVRPADGLSPGDRLLRPEVRSVGLNHRFDGAFQQALTAEWTPDDKRPTGLKLTLALGALVEPGTYDVVIGLGASSALLTASAETGKPAPRTADKYQRAQLQLVLPNAQLQPVPALKIERVAPVFGLGGETSLPPVTLRELSRRSHLTGLALDDARSGSAGLSLRAPPARVDAGGQATLDYDVEPALPLGTTVGKLVVRAPQLQGALEIPYEVTHRLAPWVIWPTLVAGLLIGFFVRVFLKEQVERTTARLASVRERRKLEDERAKSPDTDFQKAVTGAVEALNRAERGSVAEMTRALTAAESTLAEAMKSLMERRARVRGQVDALDLLLDRAWSLPADLGAAKDTARQRLAESQKALEREDVTTAAALHDTASRELQKALSLGARDLRGAFLSAVARLGKDVPLPKAISDAVAPALSQLDASAQALPQEQTDATLEVLLNTLHASTVHAQRIAEELQSQLRSLAKEVRKRVEDGPVLKDARIPAFVKQLEMIEGRWAAKKGGIRAVMQALPDDLISLLDAMAGAIRGAMRQGTEAQIEAKLSERDYREAAKMAGPPPETPFGVNPVEIPFEVAAPLGRLEVAPPSAPLRSPAAPMATLAPLSLAQMEARTFWQLALERMAQTAAVGLLVLAGGYLLFAHHFVGTATDFAGLFFWAFGTDVSVDSATNLVGMVNKRG